MSKKQLQIVYFGYCFYMTSLKEKGIFVEELSVLAAMKHVRDIFHIESTESTLHIHITITLLTYTKIVNHIPLSIPNKLKTALFTKIREKTCIPRTSHISVCRLFQEAFRGVSKGNVIFLPVEEESLPDVSIPQEGLLCQLSVGAARGYQMIVKTANVFLRLTAQTTNKFSPLPLF